MKEEPHFRVDVSCQEHHDPDSLQRWTEVTDVKPASVSSRCPHCGAFSTFSIDSWVRRSPGWKFDMLCSCPRCDRSLFVQGQHSEADDEDLVRPDSRITAIYPPLKRKPLSEHVPSPYREDYDEAASVLQASPKASAALGRRSLQRLLHDHLSIKKRSLSLEIEELVQSGQLPSDLSQDVDAIRSIGNFASHPIKDRHTGQIVDVEPEEAEWLIHILYSLYDFFFVQPSIRKSRRQALNEKLSRAGKPPMKE